MSQKKDVKVRMFGEVRKARATGGHVPSSSTLRRSLGEKCVIHSFCTGCGWYMQYTREGAEILARSARIILPLRLEGCYFETESCSLCDGQGQEIALKKIPE